VTVNCDDPDLLSDRSGLREAFLNEWARHHLIWFTKRTYREYVAEPVHALIGHYLDRVLEGEINRLMIFAPPQHGKLIAHDVPVLTSRGWKTHGDLRPGDCVFGRDGRPVRVLAVSPDDEATCEVEFTDGQAVACHPAHEWLVFDRVGHRPCERIAATGELRSDSLWLGQRGKRGGRGRYQVDSPVGVELPALNLPIPPYVLGVWLGDGTATKNCITHAPDDSAVIQRMESLGFLRTVTCVHQTTGVHTSYFRALYGPLKSAGLLGRKYIPEPYQAASREQRLALLAGLIDTDGYVYPVNGRVTLSTVDSALVEQIVRLLAGLGWRATTSWTEPHLSTSGIEGRRSVCQITFNPTTTIPTALSRKRVVRISPAIRRRSITDIRSISPRAGRCIQVEGGVYLVGERLVPTHNSELATVRFPAFWLGKRPNDAVIITSYAASLAEDKSRHCREVVESPEYRAIFPTVRVSRDSRAVSNWSIAGRRGSLLAAGVGGAVTGYGARLGIIDDPVENWEQAQSETYRNRAWDWYRTTFRPRIWEGGAIILIMTRWHQDDLAGRLLAEEGHDWTVLRLPALAETQAQRDLGNKTLGLPAGEPDPLHRRPGEPLAPHRYSKAALLALQRDVGTLAWAGEYQGVPMLQEGALLDINDFIMEDEAPQGLKLVRFWDLAAGVKKQNDYTAGGLVGLDLQNHIWIVQIKRGRWKWPDAEQQIRDTALLDGPSVVQGVESVGFQKAASDDLKADPKLLARNIVEVNPNGDKVARAGAWGRRAKDKMVHVLRGEWNRAFLDECAAFPFGKHDDQVDAVSGGVQMLSEVIVPAAASVSIPVSAYKSQRRSRWLR